MKNKQQHEEDESSAVLNRYPDSIYKIDSVPHDWLFPQIQGVVHHGGAGTTAAGLRAGLPTVIKPFFGDQRFWGQRVEELGVGVCLVKLTVDKLSDALMLVTRNHAMISKANMLGNTIRQVRKTFKRLDHGETRKVFFGFSHAGYNKGKWCQDCSRMYLSRFRHCKKNKLSWSR